MIDKKSNHTFVICAYKESEYLEECILSLRGQVVESNIIMVTSTPNVYIESLSKKYNIPLCINKGESGITQDWNFAISCAKTDYVTIAHQDDVYEKDYSKIMLETIAGIKQPLIAFSEYTELRNSEKVSDTLMLRIKRMMLLPLRIKVFRNSRFIRRRVLSFGDPICCPAVTFCLKNLELPIFQHGFFSCEDWEAWEKISRRKGAFVYVPKFLMSHRIHEESATSQILADNKRIDENYVMFCKFWPKGIAKLLNRLYTKSENSNRLD